MANKPYTDEEWLREKYLEDELTQSEIAELCDVSQGTISHHIKRSGIDTRTGGKWVGSETPDEPYTDSEWLREQYIEKRKSTTEIAESQGITGTTVRRWLREFDIPRRDNSEAQIQEVKKFHDEEWLREKYVDERRSMRDIADECGVTPSGVKKWIDNFDIAARSPEKHMRYTPVSHGWNSRGYEYVRAKYQYETSGCFVHQLVAISEGANPNKVFSNGRYHVHHKNGVKWDNRPENLELKSAKTHSVQHHHEERHSIPDEYVTQTDREELLFALRQLVNDWKDAKLGALDVAADELDGLLREL